MKSLSHLLIREMHKQNKIQTVDKAAKPRRVIKRNSIRGPRQIENLVGKRRKERSVYYEFQRNSIKHGISFDVSQGKGLLLPKQNLKITFLEKWIEHCVQSTFGAFRFLLGGSTNVQLPLAKNEIYLTFSESPSVQKFVIGLFLHAESRKNYGSAKSNIIWFLWFLLWTMRNKP